MRTDSPSVVASKLPMPSRSHVACLALLAASAMACSVGGPAVCSTNQPSQVEEGRNMAPGDNCITCHQNTEAPVYALAGTVMGAYKDDNGCNGIGGTTVRITDANGTTFDLPTTSAGNFYTRKSIVMPYTAKVLRNGKERAMAAMQTDGNCANCHTAEGQNNAPGRIVPP